MARFFMSGCAFMVVLGLAGGCATPQPVPFKLIDSESKVQRGAIFPDSQRLEVMVDGRLFQGFYIVATGSAVSQTVTGRRLLPRDTVTTLYSNSARAHLTADNGQQLSCEFLFEARRLLGECRYPAGAVLKMVAEGN